MALRNAILEVGIDPAVRQALSLRITISNECVVSKSPIISMIV